MKYINYINLRGKRSSITLTPVQLSVMRRLCQLHGFKGPNEYIRMVLRKGIHGNISMAVKIGDNCVIAAGAVVNKDVPSGSVAAGVPVKVIGKYNDLMEKRKSH